MRRIVVLEDDSRRGRDDSASSLLARAGWEVGDAGEVVCVDGIERARTWLDEHQAPSVTQLIVLASPAELCAALELVVLAPLTTVLQTPVDGGELSRAADRALAMAEALVGNGALLTALGRRREASAAFVSALRQGRGARSSAPSAESGGPQGDALIHTGKLVALGTLAGGVAHEINNPLSTILAFSEILLGEERSASDREALQFIESSAQRCKRVLDGMLRFSRHHSLKLEYGNLNHVVNNSLVLFEVMLKTHPRIHLEVSLEPTLPAANLDSGMLEQVLINLLQNAVHAMPQDQGQIRLRTGAMDGFTWVAIEDSGQGIKPDNLARLFHTGFTTKPPGVGTGLGLSIVRDIVERHHGRVEVQTAVGKGSTFTVLIPALGGRVNEARPGTAAVPHASPTEEVA